LFNARLEALLAGWRDRNVTDFSVPDTVKSLSRAPSLGSGAYRVLFVPVFFGVVGALSGYLYRESISRENEYASEVKRLEEMAVQKSSATVDRVNEQIEIFLSHLSLERNSKFVIKSIDKTVLNDLFTSISVEVKANFARSIDLAGKDKIDNVIKCINTPQIRNYTTKLIKDCNK
jgi:hypothetical protein